MDGFNEAEEKLIKGWESFSGESFDDLFWKDKRDFAVKMLGWSDEQARNKIHHGRLLSDIIDIEDGVVIVAGQMIGDSREQYFNELQYISTRAFLLEKDLVYAELVLDERNFERCSISLDYSQFDWDWLSKIRIELHLDYCTEDIVDYLEGLEKKLVDSGWFEHGYKNMYGNSCNYQDAQIELHNSMVNMVALWHGDGYVMIEFEQTLRDETPEAEAVIYKTINGQAYRKKSLSISDLGVNLDC